MPQPPAAAMVPPADPNQNFSMENMVSACGVSTSISGVEKGLTVICQDFGLEFANPLATSDVLNDFDFDSFLHDTNENGEGTFDFTSGSAFMDADGIET